ncbi:MAG: rod shape-determining protein RodA [Candidatus Protistobacter heckmanni]|nr:rod shape-determining protein RodA [Candidatus Protistobacter heckmanni]
MEDKSVPGILRKVFKGLFDGFDRPLSLIVFLLLCTGLVTLYSAGLEMPGRVQDQVRNIAFAFVVMWIVSRMSPQALMRVAVPVYTVGVALLVAVAMFGLIRKGARRWINIGVVIQPSEVMKIAMPLMLAWYFQKREGVTNFLDYLVAFVLLVVPVALIARQPDLGTALLVIAAGTYVIFFAGLSWRLIAPVLGLVVVVAALVLGLQDTICDPKLAWPLLHDYQKHRVCILLDPSSDPLGKGFHTIQSVIAIGSGGVFGKGWLHGTQTHLEFIPEKHTDFIFAVFSEEFGLIGNLVLVTLFAALIFRGLTISLYAATLFERLLAGSVTMIFFTYAFVNMGMVSGLLPVVGVPLPLISYGGTSMVTQGLALGILMSVARNRRLVQT